MRPYLLLPLVLLLAIDSPAQTIPMTHAQSLARKEVDLPANLSGKLGVLVVGFSKKSSEQTRTWNTPLLRDYANDPLVLYYQMPMLADVPTFLRGMVLQSMRRQMSAQDQAHLAPILQDAAKWKTAMRFDAPDDAYIVALDSGGHIKWRTRGAMTAESYGRLKECLTRLKGAALASCS